MPKKKQLELEEIKVDDVYDVVWPLNAPGMPLPGPNFIIAAQDLGDNLPYIKGAGKNKKLLKFGPNLQKLYDRAIYEPDFRIPVYNKGTKYIAQFVPGHVWGTVDDDPNLSVADLRNDLVYGPDENCSSVMVVGKLPGRDELAAFRNLIGPSGDLLRDTLEELGETSYPEWYVTNLIKFGKLDQRTDTIPQSFINDCLPILAAEMRIVKPDYILLMGKEAVSHVLGKEHKIADTVGTVINYKIDLRTSADEPENFHIAKVMTCSHPARILRSPDLYLQFKKELQMFVTLINGGEVSSEETDLDHRIIKDEGTLKELVDRILSEPDNNKIAVDCEWHGEHPFEPGAYLRTIQFSHKGKFGAAVVLREAGGDVGFTDISGNKDIYAARPHLTRLLKHTEDRKVRLIGHFFRADLPWLIHYGIDCRKEFEAPVSDTDFDTNPNALEGFEKTRTEGGFDTGLAAHAVDETGRYKLEIQASTLLGIQRYDKALQKWKTEYCKKNHLKADDLEGYGDCPDEILHPYAVYDVSVTRRLFDVYNGINGEPGLLDLDSYGLCSREPFWISMRASPAFLEMEMTGVYVDKARGEELTACYQAAQVRLLEELREKIKWPEFNPGSTQHKLELLFGEKYNGKVDKSSAGKIIRLRPEGATCLNLTPVKTTGKKDWAVIAARGEESYHNPSTDKEVLSILGATTPIVAQLRDINFIKHLLSSTLRLPAKDGKTNEMIVDEDGNPTYEGGLLSNICSDGRIHTHLFQTKETGRAASARPNLMAISKKREADYARILGTDYKYPLRTMLTASPGHVLIEADYSGAEIAVAAWMSDDAALADHAARSSLPETILVDGKLVQNPEYYDVHSRIAVEAFQLDCEPTKAGLKSIGLGHMRNAAKAVVFGYFYGQGPDAAARKAKEESGKDISVDDCKKLMARLEHKYPNLVAYFNSCRSRVRNDMWMCNCFGRYRRFKPTTDRQALGESERQGLNYNMQSTVADAVSRALDYMYHYRETHSDIDYKIILQIHDAILLEVPFEHAGRVWSEVIPECMVSRVPIYPCHLNGKPTGKGPYYLGAGRDAYLRWGEELKKEDCIKLGLPEFLGN